MTLFFFIVNLLFHFSKIVLFPLKEYHVKKEFHRDNLFLKNLYGYFLTIILYVHKF